MRKNKKGFTLIELLAVIVILAIIALIATPVILNIIEKSRRSAFTRSLENVVKTGKLYYMENLMNDDIIEDEFKCTKEGCFSINRTDGEGNPVKLEIDGNVGTGTITIDNNGNVSLELCGNGYCGTKQPNENKIDVKKGNNEDKKEDTTKLPITLNPAPSGKIGLIGVVYYNPTTGSGCTESDYNTNLQNHINAGNPTVTNLKSGCMKWYAYAETETTYDMILDHNTTAMVQYNSDNVNTSQKEVAQALSADTSSWKVTARLLTDSEMSGITGDSGVHWFNGNSSSGQAKGSNVYSWLFDNTYDCETYGCSMQDNNTYTLYGSTSTGYTSGYWTSNPYVSNLVFCVDRQGANGPINASNNSYGLRPVITISKN